MKFNEFNYEHVTADQVREAMAPVLQDLKEADSGSDLLSAFKQYDAIKSSLYSNAEIASIRHSCDTSDSYWTAESTHYNNILPELEEVFQQANELIVSSPYVDEIRGIIPEVWFAQAEMDRKAFSPEIIPLLQKENELADAYQDLIASAKIDFDGGLYSLAELEKPMKSQDRDVRRAATLAYWNWFEQNEARLGEIYDSLVHVRDEMAHTLGFSSYIPLGYLRMHRLDYDMNDVAGYRKQILDSIVPVANDLYRKQAQRLGLSALTVYDEKVEYPQGDPVPVNDDLTSLAEQMYHELDPEVGAFFTMMKERELLDLDARKNKAAGGYCTYINNEQAPFIFANSNGTEQDVETLCHEAGHAFQAYSSRDKFPSDCIWPTYESAEIHSMSMEFFTWPWMEKFFGDRAEDYRHMHLAGAIKFLPYGALVDHFQHEVYAHPEWTPDERMNAWRTLEKQYLPHKDYSEVPFLERGGWWMRQLHIFMDPFYYIDYTLAQVAALQFFERMVYDDEQAFDDYKAICRLGGTLPFRQIMETAHLQVPFEKGCLEKTARTVAEYFASK